jgi:N4-gp56 family major capsid protein
MSSTTFTSNSALAVKLWARKTFSDAVKTTLYGSLTGTSDTSIVQRKDELSKGEGDRVRFRIRTLETGDGGAEEDQTLEGNEDGLDFSYFDMTLGERRKAFKVDLNLSAQRTMIDVRAEAKDAIEEWTQEYLDITFMEYLSGAGYGAPGVLVAPTQAGLTSRYHKLSGTLGGNPLLAPSADRIVYGGTGNVAANTVTVGDTMTLSVIDKLVERAKRNSPTMRKPTFQGKKKWVIILSPEQVTSMRTNTTSGQWLDITKARQAGTNENLFGGEMVGEYRDTIIVESTRIFRYLGGAGGNVEIHRGLFLGAQAAVTSSGGQTDGWGRMKLAERTFDYGKRYAVAATFIWGMAKTRFQNQSDFGVIAIDTAAKAAV